MNNFLSLLNLFDIIFFHLQKDCYTLCEFILILEFLHAPLLYSIFYWSSSILYTSKLFVIHEHTKFINDGISSNIKLCNTFSVIIYILFLFFINIGSGTKSFTSSFSSLIIFSFVSSGNLSYSFDLIFSLNSLTPIFWIIDKLR